MRKIYFVFICLFLINFSGVSQQLPSYNLEGFLMPAEDYKILLIFRIHEQDDELVTRLYIPDQGSFGDESSRTIVDGDTLRLYYDLFQMHYYGYIDKEKNQVKGTYYQGRNIFPLDLDFIDDEDAVTFNRPQTPTEPFPYISQEHTIKNEREEIEISGTLFLPDTLKKHPLVIITKGGGAPMRDAMFGGHRTFNIIADHLAKNNFAVFIYDERGAGKSTGRFRDNTTRIYMMDAYNILKYLKTHPNIDSEKTGYLGHSEGALAAFKVASIYPDDVSFIISLAGPGVPILELMKQQVKDIFQFSGYEEEMKDLLIEYRSKKFQLAHDFERISRIKDTVESLTDEYARITEEMGKDPDKYGLNLPGAHRFVAQVTSPWLRYFLKLNPPDYIERTKCPVLALNGSLDMQINAKLNINAIEKALKKGGNQNYRVDIMEGLNHIFQPAKIGTQDEYMMIEQSISEEVLEIILEFLQNIE